MRSDQDGDHAPVVRVDVDADVTGARQLARQTAGQSISAGDRAPHASDRRLLKLSECLSDRDDLLTSIGSLCHRAFFFAALAAFGAGPSYLAVRISGGRYPAFQPTFDFLTRSAASFASSDFFSLPVIGCFGSQSAIASLQT